MAKMTKEEAFRAGLENPLAGDIGPLQRLYGTVQAMGEELSGADMGTPFGQRFGQRQAATKAEVKRLQALRAAHPEEFGRGQMVAQDRMDPYMLDLGLGTARAMRPGTTTYSQLGGAGQGPVEGEFADVYGIGGPRPGIGANVPRQIGYAPQPQAPYYRKVPPEMGTSFGPMSPFQQNQVGLSTGRYGAGGYAPEMAVTDFETYGPFSRAGATAGQGANTGFDQNMYQAYLRGRFARGGAGPVVGEGGEGTARMMGMGYSAEDLGQAVAPYRQGGLVYEPVGQQAGPRQIGGPGMAQRLGYERGPIEGEFSDVGHIPYGMGYRPNFSMEGAPYTPASGMSMGQRMGAGAYQYAPSSSAGYRGGFGTGLAAGAGMAAIPAAMYLGDATQRPVSSLVPQSTPLQGSSAPPAEALYGPMGPYGFAGGMDFLNSKGGAMDTFPGTQMRPLQPARARTKVAAKGGQKPAPQGQQNAPVPLPSRRPDTGWDPNLNYIVTQAIDRLFGQDRAEEGRRRQIKYGL